MDVHFVEATNGPQNWGKFAVCQFTDEEWKYRSVVDDRPLLAGRGWGRKHTLVIDLQTGEGAFFPDFMHPSDLDKHAIWVCPMFEPAVVKHIMSGDHDPMQTPALIDMPDVPFEWAGYRRGGPHLHALQQAARVVCEAWEQHVTPPGDPTDAFTVPDELNELADAIALLREVLGGPE